MSFVTDTRALEYLEGFNNIPPASMQQKYPGAPIEAIDFLEKTLVFNPFFRMTLHDAINHPLFNAVRGTKSEKYQGTPIDLEFEGLSLTNNTLRELFIKEIKTYHN